VAVGINSDRQACNAVTDTIAPSAPRAAEPSVAMPVPIARAMGAFNRDLLNVAGILVVPVPSALAVAGVCR